MLGKALIFVFVFLGILALLLGAIPPDFVHETWNPSYRNPEIRKEFEINDLVVYDNCGADNMTRPYSSLYNAPDPPKWEAGLPENQFLEVKWRSPLGQDIVYLRHMQRNWFLGMHWFSILGTLEMYAANGTHIGNAIDKNDLLHNWNSSADAAKWTAKGNKITTNFLIKRYNSSMSIGDNWETGHLQYYITYHVNWTMTGTNAFTIVGQLLAFQAPDLGIPDPWGYFLNMVISIPIWAAIGYIVYKIIAGLIPFVSGGSGS